MLQHFAILLEKKKGGAAASPFALYVRILSELVTVKFFR